MDFPGFYFISSQLTVFFEFNWEFLGMASLVMAAETSAAIQSFAVNDLVYGNDFRVMLIRGDKELGLKL
ncbi:hypothetical protein LX32DRAFT_705283 [Colletotrichum zoysiae]|uniref:Uncharacterized protein n=1 Tax=Colletotrichum zoysiae TaxID=1216348 RepID=A0AAD9H8R4_9PEZI|nr:hypothetical protein LX32DRAFT_705283 [Colletotrichum zoysiae]